MGHLQGGPAVRASVHRHRRNTEGDGEVPPAARRARHGALTPLIVFVHGVPETAELWDKVRSSLGLGSVALSLPGFGCPRPTGFGATMDDYVDWLLGELDVIDGPVDLVGHDWGAGLTYRVATAYGDRVHSWVADVANLMHPDYKWHDFAQIWQTHGEGEAFFEAQSAAPLDARVGFFESAGIEHDDALALASASNETMAGCILDLYRSATPNPYAHWKERWGPTSAPGLVLFPSQDPFGDETLSREVADMLGARHEVLEGLGHWWALEAPTRAAAVLSAFLGSIE
ncbi:MAG: alpha/beta fold hydrolase [Acidimicrobiales bacterium]